MRSWVSLFLIFVLVLPGLSCSGVVRPHVRVALDENTTKGETVGLDAAIKYANSVREAYAKAVANQGKLATWTGMALIPAGILTAFIGITGSSRGSRDAAAALSLAGAGAYGTTNWLRNVPASKLYSEGGEAISCAIMAVKPLVLSDAQQPILNDALEADGLSKKIRDVRDSRSIVRNRLAEYKAELNQNADRSYANGVDRYLEGVEESISQAELVLREGFKLQHERNSAGLELVTTVGIIQDRVDRAVISTLPSLESISDLVNNLVASSRSFQETLLSQTSPPETPEGVRLQGATRSLKDLLAGAVIDLGPKVADMEREALNVKSILDAVDLSSATTSIQDCNIDIRAPGLRLVPSGNVKLQSGVEAEARTFITGGRPLYFANLRASVAGLTVRSESQGGAAFVVIQTAAENEIPAGNYQVLVNDSSGNTAVLTVEIEPPSSEEEAGSGSGSQGEEQPTAGNDEPAPAQAALTAEQQSLIPKLCLAHLGDKVRAEALVREIHIFQASRGEMELDEPTESQVQDLLEEQDCPAELRSYAEKLLSPTEIESVQRALIKWLEENGQGQVEVEVTGTIDEATRKAVVLWKKQNQPDDQSEILTRETADAIRGL